MKIIAIDSSGLVASVAVLEDESMIAEYTVNYKITHSQTLLPMLEDVCKMIELDLETIDAIAVAKGPGSFTGLRIGSATAKGLGLALNKPIVGIPTVDALSYNLWGSDKLICPIMDARRNQVYTGLYEFIGNTHKVIMPQDACDIMDIINRINELGRPVVFLGDGVPVYKNVIADNAKVAVSFAPAHMSRQRAGALGVLAFNYIKEGIIETAAEHKPDYLRLSQAERERLEASHE